MVTKRVESRRGIDGIVSASRENSCLFGLPRFGYLRGEGGGGVQRGEQRSDTQTHAFSSTTCLSCNKQLFPPHTSAMAHCNEMIKAVLCSWTSFLRVRSSRKDFKMLQSKDSKRLITAQHLVTFTLKRGKWVIWEASRPVGSVRKEEWHQHGADFHPSHVHNSGLYQVTAKRRLGGWSEWSEREQHYALISGDSTDPLKDKTFTLSYLHTCPN